MNQPWFKFNGQSKWFLSVSTFLAIAVAGYAFALPYLLTVMPDNGFHENFLERNMLYYYLHFFAGAVALIIAPIQLWVVNRYVNVHKVLGRVYVLAVLIASLSSFYMAYFAVGGWIGSLGLTLLGCFWLFSTGKAIFHIRQKNIHAHKVWMIRSIALTFAAVTLRIEMPFLGLMFDQVTSSQIVYWLCWVGNLMVVQLWINKLKP